MPDALQASEHSPYGPTSTDNERVALVTGATGGLGRAAAVGFLRAGYKVVLTGHDASAVASLADRLGGQVLGLAGDTRNRADAERVTAAAMNTFGRIDVLLHAAGGSLAQLSGGQDKLIVDMSDEDWDLVVDVNLGGTWTWVSTVGPVMAEQGDGTILLIASGAAVRGAPANSAYAAAKAGVIALAKVAAIEFGRRGVKVNALSPGITPHDNLPPDAVARNPEQYRAMTTLGELSTPEMFAEYVVFLASRRVVSGQFVNMDSFILQ